MLFVEPISAKRFRPTPSQKRKMERSARLNKRFRRKPVEITQQPKKTRKAWVGRVTFVWLSGPKKDKKHSVMITLKSPARLYIRGQDLQIRPQGEEPYTWGEKDEDGGEQPEKEDREEKAVTKPAKKPERRLKEVLRDEYESLIEEYGPHDAGVEMAKSFIRSHNRLQDKTAKRALAKIYGDVLPDNPAAHLSFSRRVRRTSSPTASASAVEKVIAALIDAYAVLAEVPAPVDLPPLPKKSVTKKPGEKKPGAKKTDSKKPVAKKPVAKKPVTKKSPTKKPVAKKSGAKKPDSKKPGTKKPTTKKTGTKKPSKSTPAPVDLPPLPEKGRKKPDQSDPDKYRQQVGKCPRGWHFDRKAGSCAPAPRRRPGRGDGEDEPEDDRPLEERLEWDPVGMEMVDQKTGRRYVMDDGDLTETRESVDKFGEDDKGGDAEEVPMRRHKYSLPDAPKKGASEKAKKAYEKEVKKTWDAWRKATRDWKKSEPSPPESPRAGATDEDWDAYDEAYDDFVGIWSAWNARKPPSPDEVTSEKKKKKGR